MKEKLTREKLLEKLSDLKEVLALLNDLKTSSDTITEETREVKELAKSTNEDVDTLLKLVGLSYLLGILDK